jgi:hypothetical protein
MSVHEVIRRLPEISTARAICRALAMLDAILSPEARFRYYSFDSRWSPTEEVAMMDNGSGDQYWVVFSPVGAYGQGFDHESSMSPHRELPLSPWPGLFDGVPEVFREAMDEPAFQEVDGTALATVVFWRERTDPAWKCGPVEIPVDEPDVDGADWLFELLTDGQPEAYVKFAEEYYEITPDLESVRHVYALLPLLPEVVAALNPERELSDLADDIAEIGYPRL